MKIFLKGVSKISILCIRGSQKFHGTLSTECKKISVRCPRKSFISPLKIDTFKKFNHQRNRGSLAAVPSVVKFLKSVYFQRRYDAFSETPLQINL